MEMLKPDKFMKNQDKRKITQENKNKRDRINLNSSVIKVNTMRPSSAIQNQRLSDWVVFKIQVYAFYRNDDLIYNNIERLDVNTGFENWGLEFS